MTSVLFGSGLNYQRGNPVRSEMNELRRDIVTLRKQLEFVTDENIVFRKFIMKLVEKVDVTKDEFTKDLMSVSQLNEPQAVAREAGGGTVQGAGFRR
jgi:hypothetical protein